jgi:hypothetical protein
MQGMGRGGGRAHLCSCLPRSYSALPHPAPTAEKGLGMKISLNTLFHTSCPEFSVVPHPALLQLHITLCLTADEGSGM